MNPIIAMAPLEGITTHVFRKIYKKHFSGVDIFYTPFLSANHTHKFKTREKREFLPYEGDLVPQLLTNSVEDFLWAAEQLKAAGYSEVNLNAGCPSGTVFSKRKGAGMLLDTESLEEFFEGIFGMYEKMNMPEISVKTRIGVRDAAEAEDISRIYTKFPIKEVIIHPRLRKDFYNNGVDLEAFKTMYEILRSDAPEIKIMYNGDIDSVEDVKRILDDFPELDRIMIGRGLLKNPFLAEQIKGIKRGEDCTLRAFHDELYEAYSEELSGERDVLFKMKELWAYWCAFFPENEKEIKIIRKTKNAEEYKAAVYRIGEAGR